MTPPAPDLLDLIGLATTGIAIEGDEGSVDHRQLLEGVQARARALHRHGVRPGDRVVVIAPNCIAGIEIYVACLLIGAVWVGVSSTAPAAEQERQCRTVAPSLVVAGDPASAPVGFRVIDLAVIRSEPFDGGWEQPRLPLDAPCAIAFTSGTTSTPKTVPHTRAAVSLAAAISAHRLESSDRIGIALPLSIHNVMVVAAMAPILAGATAVVLDRFSAVGVAEAIRRKRLSLINALVPAVIHDLVFDDLIDGEALISLRYAGTGGAGLREDLRSAFEEKFGVRLCSSYGMTEAPGPVCFEDPGQPHHPGSSGVALPHVSIWAADDSGRRLAAGQSGELCVGPAETGPWEGLFGRTLRTGDLGRVGADGSVYVSGRKGNVIVRGGVNVNAGELEALLISIPEVRDIAVAGEPDERLGERIIAFVEAEHGIDVAPAALRAQAEVLLPHGKLPDEFVIVGELPRNAMGKIERPKLARLRSHGAK